MELTFTKRAGKHDELVIVRGGGATETVACPKQGIIPHEMVHYAVESIVGHGGFLAMVEGGKAADFATIGGDAEKAVERLVEIFQAEMWGGRVPAADFVATYEHACDARGHGILPVAASDIDAVRARLDRLTGQWEAVPLNGSLNVHI